jgi:NADPH:quinone reductase
VRSESAKATLEHAGVEHVIVTEDGFAERLGALAAEHSTTAVFDGVGGELLSKIAPSLPMHSTVYFYGFLGGAAPVSLPTALFMMKNLTLRRFSNFESATVKEPQRLVAALQALAGVIDDPLFTTRLGKEFSYEQIGEAMAYESKEGAKAILVAP